jgi:phosphatidylinositol alpha-mannosyltransferase
MKIALVCPYDFAYPGGAANHIRSLERRLTEMGDEVKVIAPASKDITLFGDRFIPIGRPLPLPTSGSVARCILNCYIQARSAFTQREAISLVPSLQKVREIWNRVSPQRSRI